MKGSDVKKLVLKGMQVFHNPEIADYSATSGCLFVNIGDCNVSVKLVHEFVGCSGIITASICGEKLFKIYVTEVAEIKTIKSIICANKWLMRCIVDVLDDEECEYPEIYMRDIYCDSVIRIIAPCGYYDLRI